MHIPFLVMQKPEKTAWEAIPALLATCFALYYTHCIGQRNSPFPGPFRYDVRELPLTRMLRLTAEAAWGGMVHGLCCRDQGLVASLPKLLLCRNSNYVAFSEENKFKVTKIV